MLRLLQTTKIRKTTLFYNIEVKEKPFQPSFQPSDMHKIDVEEFKNKMEIDSIETFSSLFENLIKARKEGVPYFNSRYMHYFF